MKILLLSLLFSTMALAEEVAVKVDGLVCSMCAQGLKKKFKEVKEVKSLSFDMDKKLVFITTFDGMGLSDEKIKNAVSEAGYTAGEVTKK